MRSEWLQSLCPKLWEYPWYPLQLTQWLAGLGEAQTWNKMIINNNFHVWFVNQFMQFSTLPWHNHLEDRWTLPRPSCRECCCGRSCAGRPRRWWRGGILPAVSENLYENIWRTGRKLFANISLSQKVWWSLLCKNLIPTIIPQIYSNVNTSGCGLTTEKLYSKISRSTFNIWISRHWVPWSMLLSYLPVYSWKFPLHCIICFSWMLGKKIMGGIMLYLVSESSYNNW